MFPDRVSNGRILDSHCTYPVVTFAAFLNCSKLEVLAFLSRLLEVVDSASEPESRSERNKNGFRPVSRTV